MEAKGDKGLLQWAPSRSYFFVDTFQFVESRFLRCVSAKSIFESDRLPNVYFTKYSDFSIAVKDTGNRMLTARWYWLHIRIVRPSFSAAASTKVTQTDELTRELIPCCFILFIAFNAPSVVYNAIPVALETPNHLWLRKLSDPLSCHPCYFTAAQLISGLLTDLGWNQMPPEWKPSDQTHALRSILRFMGRHRGQENGKVESALQLYLNDGFTKKRKTVKSATIYAHGSGTDRNSWLRDVKGTFRGNGFATFCYQQTDVTVHRRNQ